MDLVTFGLDIPLGAGLGSNNPVPNDPVFVVEKTRDGSLILKPTPSGVEKTHERSNDPVFVVEKTREGFSTILFSLSQKRAWGRQF